MKKLNHSLFLLLFVISNNSFCQESLNLGHCDMIDYQINDHQDSDGDGIVCEAKIILSNSAFYEDDEICDQSNINWTVIVDLGADGINDLEYNSSLPSSDNSLDDTNNNGIPDLYIPMTTNNEDQNIPLPDIEGILNSHNVSWSISDECGNNELCTTSFSIVDKKAPTPYCVSQMQISYTEIGQELLASDFNVGSFDNCTESDDIIASFSGEEIITSRIITCDDVVNSPIEIDVWFWDDSENRDYCTTLFTVNESSSIDCFIAGEIAGNVRTWKDEPVKNVEIILNANAPGFPMTDITDSEGNYSFGIQSEGLNYTLSASYDNNYLEGVSTLDLVIIQRHILDLAPFTNPYRIIAADVNGDTEVKVSDLISTRKLVLGIISEISTNTSWKFLDASYEFDDPLNPFSIFPIFDQDPFTIEFQEISQGEFDFIGIKTGDVSNN